MEHWKYLVYDSYNDDISIITEHGRDCEHLEPWLFFEKSNCRLEVEGLTLVKLLSVPEVILLDAWRDSNSLDKYNNMLYTTTKRSF